MAVPREPIVSPAAAIVAALFVAAFTGAAIAQTSADRATTHFLDRCVKLFPDVDKITSSAAQAGWKALLLASENERKRPFYTDIYQLDDRQRGETTGLEVKVVGNNVHCAISGSAKEGYPMERLAAENKWTEDAKTADIFNKGYPGTSMRLYRTRQNGRPVNVLLRTNDVGAELVITHIRVTDSDPP